MTNKKTTLDKKNALSALGNADSLAQGESVERILQLAVAEGH